MEYSERPPVEALRPLVECAWTLRTGCGARHLVIPDGCVDLIVNLSRSHAFVVGAMTVAHSVRFEEAAQLVALRFTPGGAYPVFGIPMREVSDQTVDLADLRQDAEEILESLHEKDPVEAADTLQREVASRSLAGPAVPARWTAAIRALTSSEAPRVRMVSERLGVSRQQVARRCKDLAGLTPSQLLRIARLRRLLSMVDSGDPSGWAGLAVAAGYYDQAHMISETKALTGLTPGKLRPNKAEM